MAETKFKKLLEPYHIGRVKTRNRILKTGAGTSFIEKTGFVGETMKGFYGSLAKGGVGLITIESTGVDFPLGIHHGEVQLHLDDDKYISSYHELTEVIHQYDCPVFIQLFHSGPWHPTKWMGLQPIASSTLSKSELPYPHLDPPRGLTVPEIQEVINKFARGAERAQKAGFDGIEINASSAHLINSFLSRVWNKREDQYGYKDMDSRSLFLVEIIREIKRRLGQDFPITVLITGLEVGVDKGTTPEEAQGFARILQDVGVDAIQVRAFGYGVYNFIHPGPEQMLVPEPPEPLDKRLDWSRKGAGAFVPLAEALKRAVNIPVITVGRIDPLLGEKILQQGKADIIGMHRWLLADPELPNKIAAGKSDNVAPCTACLYCWYRRRQNQPIQCRINAALGHENEYTIQPAVKKKKVLIVGGGPAGMEAARVASIRGHQVTLYEKSNKLGGLLHLASMVKENEVENIECVEKYLKAQITRLNVNIKLGREVNTAVIEEIKPDVVILAGGGVPANSDIPGIDKKIVLQGSDLHRQLKFYLKFFSAATLKWLTKVWMPIGKNVIIIGGSLHGMELAEFLTRRGRNVTLIESSAYLGEGLYPDETKEAVLSWLARKGVTSITEAKIKEITNRGLAIITHSGDSRIIPADSILTAIPLKPNTLLLKDLEGKAPEIYAVGDCRDPKLTVDAVADGFKIARII